MTTTRSVAASSPRTRSAALLLVDVDGFPAVRSRVGHAAAEAVLASVATLLAEVAGGRDLVRRCDAVRFLVLLPGAGPVPARKMAERVRAEVADLAVPIPLPAGTERVDGLTVSVGAAVHEGTRPDFAVLFWCADAALYVVKRGGGDAVGVAGSTT